MKPNGKLEVFAPSKPVNFQPLKEGDIVVIMPQVLFEADGTDLTKFQPYNQQHGTVIRQQGKLLVRWHETGYVGEVRHENLRVISNA